MDIYELIELKPEQREAFDRSVLLENEASKAAWRKAREITDLTARQKAEAEILETGFQSGALHIGIGRIAFKALKTHFMRDDTDDEFVANCKEIIIASGAEYCYHTANKIFKGPWPAAENVISKSAQWSHAYNVHILKGNGKIGEIEIAKNSIYSVLHALLTIRGRWPPGEKAICKSPRASYEYACDVIDGRYPAGERAISTDAHYEDMYASLLERKAGFNPRTSAKLLATERQSNEEVGE